MCHLRDIEVDGYHNRIRAMLNENNPSLASIEGYSLAIQRDYENEDLSNVVSAFHSAREKTILLLKSIDDSQWNRTACFEGYGNITLRGLIHFLFSHDLEHLSSLRWVAWKTRRRKIELIQAAFMRSLLRGNCECLWGHKHGDAACLHDRVLNRLSSSLT